MKIYTRNKEQVYSLKLLYRRCSLKIRTSLFRIKEKKKFVILFATLETLLLYLVDQVQHAESRASIG